MLPFIESDINYQLNKALEFFQRYTGDSFPLILSTKHIAPNSFHRVLGRQGYFPPECATSEGATILVLALLKAFEATGVLTFKTLALNILEGFLNYFYIQDVPLDISQGVNTPLWQHHWLILAYGSVVSEGNQDTNDPFNFGIFGQTIFSNGVAYLESDLSRVFSVFTGNLYYKNMYAPTLDGETFAIAYWVSDGFKVFPNGNREATAEPSGKLVTVNAISGTRKVNYTRRNAATITSPVTPLQGQGLIEPYPIQFPSIRGTRKYLSTAFDALWWAYDSFKLAFKHTNNPKYFRASEITKFNVLRYSTFTDKTFWYKKEPSSDPLRLVGSLIVQTNDLSNPLAGYQASRVLTGDKKDFLALIVNNAIAGSYPTIEVQNYVAQVYFDPLVKAEIEAAINVSSILEIVVSLSPEPNDFSKQYRAYWYLQGDSNIRSLQLDFRSFLKFESACWFPTIAEIPLFIYNSASFKYIQDTVFDINSAVVVATLPSSASGCGLINATYTPKLPNIVYKCSGAITLRITNANNQIFNLDIFDTSNTWQTLELDWRVTFNVADSLVTEIVFQNNQNSQSVLHLFYLGKKPEQLPVPAQVYKASVVSKLREAHTLWLGDFKPSNNSFDTLKYTSGVVPFTINTNDGTDSSFRGKQWYPAYQSAYYQLLWGENARANAIVALYYDAQQFYNTQNIGGAFGLLAPNFLPYDVENIPYLNRSQETRKVAAFPLPFIASKQVSYPGSYAFNAFSWQGLDPNTRWSPYCFRALEDLARYYFLNPKDSKARKVLINFARFIDADYTFRNSQQPLTDIPPSIRPQSNYKEPHASAILGTIFLYMNRANLETELTWKLIKISVDFITSEFVDSGNMSGCWSKNQPSFTHNGQNYQEFFSFWLGKIIEFYSELLLYKNEIKQSSISESSVFPNLVLPYANQPFHYSDSITESDFPVIKQQYADGTGQRVSTFKYPKTKKIQYRFVNLDSDLAAEFIKFYNLVNTNKAFKFDISRHTHDEFKGFWMFDSVPDIKLVVANQEAGIYNISGTIKQTSNFKYGK